MDKQLSKQDNHFLGSGWAFPISFSAGNAELDVTQYENNINNSIDVILKTKKGERCMEPDFGSGLQEFFFRKMDETLKGEIRDAVESSLRNHEPRITVQEVDVDYPDLQLGLVEITVVYVYNQTNTRHNYVFPFHLKEGTNLG
ncbi:MAG: GPW/gp25 family protein [Flavobacteriales bacterium]|nr:GPW/gp25 family protein [Flavobacteriales bacterium]